MAKKKAKGVGQRAGKTRVELRLDDDVYESIKRIADGAEITVNQLINGLARWAGANGHIGEPDRTVDGVVHTKPIPGVVWFGKAGQYYEEQHKEAHWEEFRENLPDYSKGQHSFTLDFTERRVVREDV